MSEEKYDFEFITGALGLVRHPGGAFNPAQVVNTYQEDDGSLVITLVTTETIRLAVIHVQVMEALIRQRQDDIKAKQREQIKEQILTQHSIIEEINNKPAPGHIVPPNMVMKGRRN